MALHFSPHPDDELIGAPATLMALRDAGWRVVNVACGLGRPEQRERREAELREACRRAGFELALPEERELGRLVAVALRRYLPALVVGPDREDPHPAHRLVGEAVWEALADDPGTASAHWTWAVWSSLPHPTLATRFGVERLEEILAALAAHRGELERNDYRRLVRGRAEACAVLGPELLFGFGADARPRSPYAELLGEWRLEGDEWIRGEPRWLDPELPL